MSVARALAHNAAMPPDPLGILWITGTLASGKTAVAIEIGRQLEAAALPCAVVDLDWLGWVHVGDGFRDYDRLMIANLRRLWPGFAEVGVRHLVLARALLRRDALETLASGFPGSPIVTVRLDAARRTLEQRLSSRDQGATLREHLAELDHFTTTVARAALEDAVVSNDDRPIEEVAREILGFTRWTGGMVV
ncbi:MAG: hypothetical protein ACHQ52_08100 [Candidatus Eisenbacteria bacterium]